MGASADRGRWWEAPASLWAGGACWGLGQGGPASRRTGLSPSHPRCPHRSWGPGRGRSQDGRGRRPLGARAPARRGRHGQAAVTPHSPGCSGREAGGGSGWVGRGPGANKRALCGAGRATRCPGAMLGTREPFSAAWKDGGRGGLNPLGAAPRGAGKGRPVSQADPRWDRAPAWPGRERG